MYLSRRCGRAAGALTLSMADLLEMPRALPDLISTKHVKATLRLSKLACAAHVPIGTVHACFAQARAPWLRADLWAAIKVRLGDDTAVCQDLNLAMFRTRIQTAPQPAPPLHRQIQNQRENCECQQSGTSFGIAGPDIKMPGPAPHSIPCALKHCAGDFGSALSTGSQRPGPQLQAL